MSLYLFSGKSSYVKCKYWKLSIVLLSSYSGLEFGNGSGLTNSDSLTLDQLTTVVPQGISLILNCQINFCYLPLIQWRVLFNIAQEKMLDIFLFLESFSRKLKITFNSELYNHILNKIL